MAEVRSYMSLSAVAFSDSMGRAEIVFDTRLHRVEVRHLPYNTKPSARCVEKLKIAVSHGKDSHLFYCLSLISLYTGRFSIAGNWSYLFVTHPVIFLGFLQRVEPCSPRLQKVAAQKSSLFFHLPPCSIVHLWSCTESRIRMRAPTASD